MPTRTGEVAGVVLREGKPSAARIEIWLERPIDDWQGGTFLSFDDAGVDRDRWLERRSAPPLAVASAGPDGRFAFDGLAPASYAVVATAADGLVAEGTTGVTAAGERAVVELHLQPCRETLRGRIRNADGRPSSATVVVRLVRGRWGLEDTWGPAPTSTDADGRFAVGSLPVGRVLVTAFDRNGLQRTGRVIRVPFDGEYVLTLDADAVEATGRVVRADDGAPIPNAEVSASPPLFATWPPGPRAAVDPAGRFRLRVHASTWRLVARAAGFVEAWAEGPWNDVTLRLSPAARLWGRASAPGGVPAAGGRVVVSRDARGAHLGGRGDLATRTDADGRYEFARLPAGDYSVSARGGGWVSANFLAPDDTRAGQYPIRLAAADARQVDLPLTRGGRVEGSLLDHTGKPFPGARIVVSRDLVHGKRGREDPLPWSAYWDASDVVATEVDGGFAITSLVPGVEYRIGARPSGAPEAPPQRVVPNAESPVRVVLRLPVPRWVQVTVVDRDSGAPVPGASVAVSCDSAAEDAAAADESMQFHFRSFSESARGRTDGRGQARLGPVGAGALLVSATADGYVEADNVQTVEDGGSSSAEPAATVRLERGRRVEGRVRMPDGTPAQAAVVTLRHDRGGGSSTSVGTQVDETGAFEFLGVGSGTYALEARVVDPTGDYEAEMPVPASGTDLVLRLTKGPGPRKLVVRVVDPDGHPVPHADVHFRTGPSSRGGFFREGRVELDLSSAEGSGEVTGTVTVESARDAYGVPLPLGRAVREGVRTGQVIQVQLAPEKVIEGRVLDPSGKGVPGAKVRADPIDPGEGGDLSWRNQPWLWNIADAFLTDASGAFRIGHLGAGEHGVYVLPPAMFATPASTPATAGQKGLEIRLTPGSAPVVTVLDFEGKPVPGARVLVAKREDDDRDLVVANLFQEHSPGIDLETGADGSARVAGLDASGSYALGIRPPAGRLDLAEHVEPRWSGEVTTVRLGRGLTLAGLVRDSKGLPVANVWVMCERESGVETHTTTNKDGEFRFTRLGPGTFRLTVHAFEDGPGRTRRRAIPQSVPAGREDVVLVLTD